MSKKKLTLSKQTLKDLAVRTGVTAGPGLTDHQDPKGPCLTDGCYTNQKQCGGGDTIRSDLTDCLCATRSWASRRGVHRVHCAPDRSRTRSQLAQSLVLSVRNARSPSAMPAAPVRKSTSLVQPTAIDPRPCRHPRKPAEVQASSVRASHACAARWKPSSPVPTARRWNTCMSPAAPWQIPVSMTPQSAGSRAAARRPTRMAARLPASSPDALAARRSAAAIPGAP